MKLATFIIRGTGQKTIGLYQNDKYLDIVSLSEGSIPNSMQAVLEDGDNCLKKIQDIASGANGVEHAYSAEEVELQSPVRPGKIIHTSCNFDAHLSELEGWEAEEWKDHGWDKFHFEHPTGFLEAPSCIVGSGVGIEIPRFTQQLDYEIEVGIVIGKTCKNATIEEAMSYVAGLMIFNDVSARDIQAREHANNVILMGKSFDGSCPFGPWLVTLESQHENVPQRRSTPAIKYQCHPLQHRRTGFLVVTDDPGARRCHHNRQPSRRNFRHEESRVDEVRGRDGVSCGRAGLPRNPRSVIVPTHRRIWKVK
jgi:2-keto-4-pentenoate hydratase/2-oxohepta-3-ene-1,7-dioic acid hydratase in catechol pathway